MEPMQEKDLYAHALAMEKEAAERYAEFASRMADEGNDEVAAVFSRLARQEGEHCRALLDRDGAGERLPPERYRWLDAGAPEAAAHDLVFRLLTPRQALAIALDAERRAREFFTTAARVATDPQARALARRLAAEEDEHIAALLAVMARTPAPPDWERVLGETNR